MRSPIPVATPHQPAQPSAPLRKQWCRSPPSAVLAQAIRRSRSITTVCSPPRRSRSISRRAYRSAKRRRRSTTGWPGSACRLRSTALSRGRPGRFQQSLAHQPLLIAAALLAVYIVLGVLYERYVHPITILSTLPSAGVGPALALIATASESHL